MSNSSERLPHIELRLVREGIAASPTGQRKQTERTKANRGDAGGHCRRLSFCRLGVYRATEED